MSKVINIEQLETSLTAINNKMNTKLQEVVEVNLDLNNIPQEYTKFQDTPVGHILSFIGDSAPAHYLKCDGAVYNINDYVELSRYFLSEFGSYNYFGGDGTITFAVPSINGSSYNSGNDSILPCIKYESTLAINTGTIINTPNPLTTEPLEYGHFTLSADQSSLVVGNLVNLDTVTEGNLTLSENKVKLTGGKTYSINFYVRINSGKILTCELYDYTNNVVITECVTASGYPNASPNHIITPLVDCLIGIRISYIDTADYITKRMSYLTVLEYRNNPINQYGGFQIIKLFEGSMKTDGLYTLSDYVKNYSLILVECTDYATDKKDITPVMTSNTTPSPYVVSGFTAFGTDALYGYFTETGSNTISNTTTGSGDIILDFGTKTKVNLIEITPITTGSSRESYRARTITIFGSNDGSTYNQLYKSTTDLVTLYGANIIPINFDTTQEYRYYKFTLFSSANTRVGVNKIKFYTTSLYDVTDKIEYFVPDARGFKISDNTILVGENTLTGYINNDLVEVYGIYGELPSLLSGGEF